MRPPGLTVGSTMASTKNQIAAFIARSTPDIASQFRKARTEVRALFPRGFELVYDNYNALGCGYSTTAKASGVVISLVAYPKWVTLFFFHGAKLPDPGGILQGAGSRIRSVRLASPEVLKSRAVRAFLKQAIAPHREGFDAAPRLSTHIKSVAAKQLPRRPRAKVLRSTTVGRKRTRSA